MKKLLLIFILLGSVTAFSQGTVSGTLIDNETGDALPTANIVETGTLNGTVSDFDGNFTLEVSKNQGSITISFVGYAPKKVNYTLTNGTANLGNITIELDADALGEIVIVGTGVIDLADDRKTPVAVSTITAREIQSKATGNVEFTEAMKNTPSVYVANQAGGFGDSQVFLRGFDDTNTAYLLNGQPINSVEDGRIFWSNWAGMADVANAIQIQRGLGSSKLAISSVGGTVNIISKTTDKKQGGFTRFLAGNDSYFKGTAAYDTGLNEKGWAFSFLLDYWQAHRKFAEGTAGQGQNYLFSVGYKPNEKHAFNFLITGAPQYHDQNFSKSLEDYALYGEKYNGNSGFLNGSRETFRRNYYHKPVLNLNWDFDINEKTDLSTVLYASWGRGGGTGDLGRASTPRNEFGQVDFDQLVANNIANAENGIGVSSGSRIIRASVNNHNWYGALSNLNYEANENWSFNVGFDVRLYHGDHFRQIHDLLGLRGYMDNDRVLTTEYGADPWSALSDFAPEGERVAYDYSEDINYQGVFVQVEYTAGGFSAFFQGAFSNQSFQREGRFEASPDGLGESEKLNKTGYNVKGGIGYAFDDNHSIFANAGYYSRQPYLDNIFADIRNSNALAEPEVDNEAITGIEGGYRFQNDNFRLNLDIYRTEWGNRFLATGGVDSTDPNNPIGFTDRYTDVTQLHQGVEFDFEYRPDGGGWKLRGFGSIGNWKFEGSTPFTRQNDDTGAFIQSGTLDLSGTKVGNAAQTSFGAGATWNITDGLSVDADYNIYADLYGFVDPSDVIEAAQAGMTYQPERLRSYNLVDAGLTYRFLFGSNKLTFRGNVYNLFNEVYISQQDAFGIFFGIGRTYNASLRYDF
ncbi:MAG: TonB-dependent receptor [Altibacter sp.]|uniref:TonB-dependent receptor n=1 Tax=Altibacter sp. TaxID=2024823 RepID=UPI000C943603|nr:TonB-dependent receptor [Altibacter sp.]MAP54245.1 TonB-dependent receptor [Altibacter sp.]